MTGLPRNIPISLSKGSDHEVKFVVSEGTDLRNAVIVMTVKRATVDPNILLTKSLDINVNPDLIDGKFTFVIKKEDVASLTPRTYKYELKITQSGLTRIPLLGDFKVFSTNSG